jgi:AAA domain
MKMLAHSSENAIAEADTPERPVLKSESKPNGAPAPRPASPAPRFHKATKCDAKLRLAVCGPSGSGKTYTLLKVATELGGPIAVVDTERGSASKYADLFEFDVMELGSYNPLDLIKIIDAAAQAGYRVLCIDSLSHFWMGKDGELDQVDRAARRMQTPNSFAAWKHVTPIHNQLVDKITCAPIHVLVSLRSKTEWILDRDDRTGKTAPRKVGLAPVMRDGIEYEFDVCGDMDQENTLLITKTRCPKLAGGIFPKPGKELADALKEWLQGVAPQVYEPLPTKDVLVTRAEPKEDGQANGVSGLQPASAIPQELVSIWKRMCSPRGVIKELDDLRTKIEQLAGSTGVAECQRILRQHGVGHAKQFKSSQPARMCAKDVFGLLEELRRNASDNQRELAPVSAINQGIEVSGAAQEVR